MKALSVILVVCLGFATPLPAVAQHIGVLQSAETMNQGTIKFMVAPILVFGRDGADDEFGVAVRGGYGFTERFDAEAKLGFFESGTFVGADGELWILQSGAEDSGLDFSVAAGIHGMFGKKGRGDTLGFELTPLLSGHVTKNIELCGALDASFEKIRDAGPGVDDTFTIVHVVPGIEYRLSDTADLVGEVGIGLNDDSDTYVGVGVAFYLRP